MPSSLPRTDLRLASGDPGKQWQLTVSGGSRDARLTAVYRTSCGGRLELVIARLHLHEAPQRLQLRSTAETTIEANSEGIAAVEEAVQASRSLLTQVMFGRLVTLTPGTPCEGAGRRHRRVASSGAR